MHVANTYVKSSPATRFVIYLALNVASILVVAVSLIFLDGFNPLLIFLPTIAFCTWYGGFFIGAITTAVSMLSIAIMLFIPTNHPLLVANITLFVELCIFFFVGVFISYVIHLAKEQDKIVEYQRRLRQTHHIIETLEKSYESAHEEIKARDQFLAIASHPSLRFFSSSL